jgi:hypothetical protein
MSNSADIICCKFPSSCIRPECNRKHYIAAFEDRVIVKQMFDNNYDVKIHNEKFVQGFRNVSCFSGLLCSNVNCKFRHNCSFEFRREFMVKEWRKILRKDYKDKVFAEMKKKYSISDDDLEMMFQA